MLDSIRVEKDNNSLILLLTIWSMYKIQSSIIDQSITTSLCLLVRFSIEWFSFNGIKAIDLLAKNSVKKFKNIIISYYIHRWGNQFITHFLSNPLLARFPASSNTSLAFPPPLYLVQSGNKTARTSVGHRKSRIRVRDGVVERKIE